MDCWWVANLEIQRQCSVLLLGSSTLAWKAQTVFVQCSFSSSQKAGQSSKHGFSTRFVGFKNLTVGRMWRIYYFLDFSCALLKTNYPRFFIVSWSILHMVFAKCRANVIRINRFLSWLVGLKSDIGIIWGALWHVYSDSSSWSICHIEKHRGTDIFFSRYIPSPQEPKPTIKISRLN